MVAVDSFTTRHQHPKGKLRRVLRWFRPSEAELRRQRTQPHPFPAPVVTGMTIGKESRDEQPA